MRLKDGTKISALYLKPEVNGPTRIDSESVLNLSGRKVFMINDIIVYFPPDGKEIIEFKFFLENDGQRFYETYLNNYSRYKEELPLCETFDQYISKFLTPFLLKFTTIRLGVDPFNKKTTWIGINDEGQYTLNLPSVNYDFYYGAAKYRSHEVGLSSQLNDEEEENEKLHTEIEQLKGLLLEKKNEAVQLKNQVHSLEEQMQKKSIGARVQGPINVAKP